MRRPQRFGGCTGGAVVLSALRASAERSSPLKAFEVASRLRLRRRNIANWIIAAISLALGSKLAYRIKEEAAQLANVEKVSVALTPEMAAMMRRAVETGEYASASEVMREALREWKHRRIQRERAVDELALLWDEGMASGLGTAGDEAFGRIRSALDAKPSAGKPPAGKLPGRDQR